MSSSTFTIPATVASERRAQGRVTWKRGLATGAVAAGVVTAIAAAFRAVGHPLSVSDGAIPLIGFAQMVLLATVVGIVIARHTSRSTFYRVAVALTALSCLPDLALGEGLLSKVGLVLTHVVAALIIVPRLARDRR
jgi:hypothetical protein